MEKLMAAGYEAYFVGGCVRDALYAEVEGSRGNDGLLQGGLWMAGDVDVATNALPWQVKDVFAPWTVVETGLRHGTVTVVLPKDSSKAGVSALPVSVEVTTFRSDGVYSDRRRPDQVVFLPSIEEDLARRDFTMNAMACDLEGRLVDPFGGHDDLRKRIIKAVGNAEKRFQEDGLRIMRALRFSSTLGFAIEEETAQALLCQKELLRDISAERLLVELKKLVAGTYAGDVIRKYVDVLGVVIPELSAMKGFQQHNAYHKYDVLEHCVRAMETVRTTAENRAYMKLAALFHDIGKPLTFSMDEQGIGHFYGHPARSEALVREILVRLKADRFTLERTAMLVKRHDLLFERDERLLKKWMNRLTPEVLFEILEIKRADNLATGNMSRELLDKFDGIRVMMEDILTQEQCFSLKDLAVNGTDLLALGMKPSPEIGRMLDALLEAVMDGRCANEKKALLALALEMLALE